MNKNNNNNSNNNDDHYTKQVPDHKRHLALQWNKKPQNKYLVNTQKRRNPSNNNNIK